MCTSPNLSKGLYDHVGKGLYLSKSKFYTSPNLSQGLHDHVGQRFVPLQIYLKDCMTMWGKGFYLSSGISYHLAL